MAGPASDTCARGSPYERYMGRWSRRLAPRFLDWLALPTRLAWVDVGCGTGALAAAILDRCEPREVTGVEPSEGFRTMAAPLHGRRATVPAADAPALPLADAACDAVVSGLVLNFVPDTGAALREMGRVAGPGGTVAAYVWDYADGMQMLKRFWDVAASLDPAAVPMHEGARFPLCHPVALRRAFEDARLADVDVGPLDLATRFADFDDYWQPFLGGQGPAPAYVASLDDDRRTRLCAALKAALPHADDGSITLDARAWAVRGTRPRDHDVDTR